MKTENDPGFEISKLQTVAGFDISSPKDDDTVGFACFVVMSFPQLKVLYKDSAFVKIDAPYCPGFLAFKEVPHFLTLYEKFQKERPDLKVGVVLVDGNGILHCNECGCASHLGVLLDVPTIGCGKTIFAVDGINKGITDEIKEDFKQNQSPKGAYYLLKGRSGKVWGAGVKSGKDSVDPLIVSVGHRINIETAIKVVDACSLTRVPEPIRFSDKWSRQLVTDYEKSKSAKTSSKTTPNKSEMTEKDDGEGSDDGWSKAK